MSKISDKFQYYYRDSIINNFVKLIRFYKNHCRDSIIRKVYSQFLPENPLYDDIYLVCFPKSGSTWLTFLMANVHLKMSGVNLKVTFFNIEHIIPQIELVRCLKEKILDFPGYRVIKSHSGFNPFYKKIIYLVRDPRDVMISHYWYLKNLGIFKGDLSYLIRSPNFGIEAWCQHVERWVETTPDYNQIYFIRFEDIKSDTLDVLRRIYTLLGHEVPTEVLEQAITLSSFENMKKLEAEYNYGAEFRFPGYEFVRQGKSGGYRTEISAADLNFINQRAARWLARFKYDLD
jgi:hypothetical protein